MTARTMTEKIFIEDMERSIVRSIYKGYYMTAQHQLRDLMDYSRGV